MIGSTPTTGYLQLGSVKINTTGVLGRWRDSHGQVQTRAFPHWATIPSSYNLAAARRWHLAFAWVLAVGLIAFLGTRRRLLRSAWQEKQAAHRRLNELGAARAANH